MSHRQPGTIKNILSGSRTKSLGQPYDRYGTGERANGDRRGHRTAPDIGQDEVRALLFEVFGTVVDWRASMIGHLATFAARRGITGDWATIADDWRGQHQPILAEIRSGDRDYVSLDIVHRESLLAVLNRHGIRGLSDQEITTLTEGWHDLSPWPDTIDGLRRLGTKCQLVSLSNTDLNMSIDIARNAGFNWDLILGAEPVRSYKPQPQVYLHAATATGLRPRNMMMVSADHRDLAAAADLGFRTALVRRQNEHRQDRVTDLSPKRAWDIAATDLVDLWRQLDDLSFELRFDRTLGTDPASPATAPVRLSRIRAAAVIAVVAGGAGLGFGQGYRLGLEHNTVEPVAGTTDQPQQCDR